VIKTNGFFLEGIRTRYPSVGQRPWRLSKVQLLCFSTCYLLSVRTNTFELIMFCSVSVGPRVGGGALSRRSWTSCAG